MNFLLILLWFVGLRIKINWLFFFLTSKMLEIYTNWLILMLFIKLIRNFNEIRARLMCIILFIKANMPAVKSKMLFLSISFYLAIFKYNLSSVYLLNDNSFAIMHLAKHINQAKFLILIFLLECLICKTR